MSMLIVTLANSAHAKCWLAITITGFGNTQLLQSEHL